MKLEQLEALAKGWLDDPTGDPDRVEPLARGVLALVRVAKAAQAWADSDECDKFLPNRRRETDILEALAALEQLSDSAALPAGWWKCAECQKPQHPTMNARRDRRSLEAAFVCWPCYHRLWPNGL